MLVTKSMPKKKHLQDAEEHFKCIMDRHNIHAPSTVDMALLYMETVLTKLHNMQTNVHNGCCGLVVVTVPCPKIICRIINKDKYIKCDDSVRF